MIFHVFGLSGVGKTTLANNIKLRLEKEYHTKVMILDGDKFRENISSDLGFSKNDREENIRRMFEYAKLSSANNIITIVSAISPYNAIRTAYKKKLNNLFLIWLTCNLSTLIKRDPKGLYKRALLDDTDLKKIKNFTGISDVFEEPKNADLTIDTGVTTPADSEEILVNFILDKIKNTQQDIAF